MGILEPRARVEEHDALVRLDPALFQQMHLGGQAGGAFRRGKDARIRAHGIGPLDQVGVRHSHRSAVALSQSAQDQEIAQLKLETMSVSIDKLTESQIRYQTAYNEGT